MTLVAPTLVARAPQVAPSTPLSLVQAVWEAALHPGTTVISAVPGTGKSHAAVEVIAELLQQRHLQRVLIAVSSTDGPHSLAAQIQRDVTALFQACRLSHGVQIISGRAAMRARTPAGQDAAEHYLAQFRDLWTRSGVVIISHAHLPLLGVLSGPTRVLGQAELLIVDENPTSSLLVTADTLADAGLSRLTPQAFLSGLVEARYLAAEAAQEFAGLLDRPEACGAVQKRSLQPGWTLSTFHLDSPGFLGRLQRLAGQPFSAAHRVAFMRALTRALSPGKSTSPTAGRFAALLAQEFGSALEQLTEGAADENRFGLTWPYGQHQPGLGKAQLRFHVLPTLPWQCPTVVLDAYASEPDYRGVFEHLRHVRAGPEVTTQIEVAPAFRLDAIDLRHTKNERKLVWVLLELREFVRNSPRNTLVVVHKALLSRTSRCGQRFRALVQRHLGEEVTLCEQTMAPQTTAGGYRLAYWGALNGSNSYAGWDVVALTSMRLPDGYVSHELAARLTSQAERRAVRDRRERADLMQALHRSRQHRTPPGPGRPRLLVAFNPHELCPKSCQAQATESCEHWREFGVTFDPFVTDAPIVHGAKNPGWARVALGVAREVEQHCGALPLVALQTLGLMEPPSLTPQLHRDVGRASRTLLFWAGQTPGSALHRWAQQIGWQPCDDLSEFLTRSQQSWAEFLVTPLTTDKKLRGVLMFLEQGASLIQLFPGKQTKHLTWAHTRSQGKKALQALLSPLS